MRHDLATRAREGDHDAFTQLVAGSIGQLYRTARLILGRDDLAEDAVQEALMRAWLGIKEPARATTVRRVAQAPDRERVLRRRQEGARPPRRRDPPGRTAWRAGHPRPPARLRG